MFLPETLMKGPQRCRGHLHHHVRPGTRPSGTFAMKNLFLSTVLIIIPVGLFAVGYNILTPAQTAQVAAPSLDDMMPFMTITTDVQYIATTGDLPAAKLRITDLETA
jgi:hypothetical protein